MLLEGGEEVVETALIEIVAALLSPGDGEIGSGAVDGLGGLEEVLLGVEDVDDLGGAGKVFFGEVPDPGGAVAEDDLLRGVEEASALDLAEDALGEGGSSVSVSRMATVSMAAL